MRRVVPATVANAKENTGFARNRVGAARVPLTLAQFILVFLGVMSNVYVANRLWQDARLRTSLVNLAGKKSGEGEVVLTVEESLKGVENKALRKRVVELETELISARKQGFVPFTNSTTSGKKLKAVIAVNTAFGQRTRRDAIRKSWVSSGVSGLKNLEINRGLAIRFVIGRSPNRGDSSDRLIDEEEKEMQDFMILENHVEANEELPKKTKLFFLAAVDRWDAEYYWKVDDDVFVDLEKLEELHTSLLEKPRAYVGCMKSGEVVSDSKMRWYEAEWWKFGDAKVYYRHAAGQMYGLSKAVAQYVAINNDLLHEYQNEDISVGSWMIGLDVDHVDERRLCCGSPPDESL